MRGRGREGRSRQAWKRGSPPAPPVRSCYPPPAWSERGSKKPEGREGRGERKSEGDEERESE